MIHCFWLFIPVFITIFILLEKYMGKKNHIMLNIFYSLTLMIFFPIEILVDKIIKIKYKKRVPLILNMLNQKQIPFHVAFGSFLFAYRDNHFADRDLDIGIYKKDWNDEINKTLLSLGFFKKQQWTLDSKISEINYYHKLMKISMDVFIIDEKDYIAPTFNEKKNMYTRRPKNITYKVADYSINGLLIKGPAEPEKYLEWNYGVWRKKDKNYHWLYGSSFSPSIVVNDANISYTNYFKQQIK